ncbi:LysM domain-containing protein [Bradyrhizobium sp. USDA 3458]|uniref:LysM domain-containing protein n=1 Tax=Bradyrhizobium sp. USDA 3458 TaxID=2591461 RepID=UPI0011411ACC|nr:LysM domain-containing protein [Bradyrhizobium sp. USDA 3458]
MTNPIEALFGAGLLPKTDFPLESRYHGNAVRAVLGPDGAPTTYLARRLVPSPERFATLAVYRVAEGDRLDRIAARLTGNPEQFWMLCDANGAIWPEELEVPETRIRQTLPVDVSASEEQK